MPANTAEEAAHAHARATVAFDLGAVIRNMTPEGLARAMQIGNTEWQPTGYKMTGEARDGDDYLFDIRFDTELGPLSLRYRYREIDGAWKIVDVERTPSQT